MSNSFKAALLACAIAGASLVWIGAAHAVPLTAPTTVQWMDSLDNQYPGGALVWTRFSDFGGHFPFPHTRQYDTESRYGGVSVWGTDVTAYLWDRLGDQQSFDNVITTGFNHDYGLPWLALKAPVIDCRADVDAWLLPKSCHSDAPNTPVRVSEPNLFGWLQAILP